MSGAGHTAKQEYEKAGPPNGGPALFQGFYCFWSISMASSKETHSANRSGHTSLK